MPRGITKKSSNKPNLRVHVLTDREKALQAEVETLQAELQRMLERIEWGNEARASAREANTHLAKELERMRTERDAAIQARYDVARLEGVLQGLERAGKLEPEGLRLNFGGNR